MPVKLYYFSGTGNSLYAAKQIQKGISGSELIPIVKVRRNKEVKIDADVIGIITPLYFGGLPNIVQDFIQKMNPGRGCYIFAVITAGFPLTGAALSQIKGLLKEKSNKLNAGFYIKMTDNYILKFEIEKEDEKMKKDIMKNITGIIESVKNRKKKFSFELTVISSLISKPWQKKAGGLDSGFYLSSNCNACGTCARVCGVNNIIMENGTPRWLHNCQFCLACLHFCPRESIQYGNNTLNKKRYHNPNITLKEILDQKTI